ncbi:MAG: SGNH/GDSL hydrolase family protein [Spirulina sp. SIO3F2]|nr:SGNH/GDSL hydrolase family protein [Spirulina sp. SIO3F2]
MFERSRQQQKYLRVIVLLLASGLLGSELALRWLWGLGQPVLLQADSEIGYLFQPNQDKHRFGRQLQYNRYGQRSEPLRDPKPSLRILMTGDSVLNGGNLIDQAETIAEQVEAQLHKSSPTTTVEVLNASAGSWGIGNQWAYLQRFGDFNSDVLILQIGTHDLVQATSTGEHIGRAPNFPDRTPILAWQEVWSRYIWPQLRLQWHLRQVQPPTEPPNPQTTAQIEQFYQQQFEQNLQVLTEIFAWAERQSLPVWVVYTPDRADVLPPTDFPLDHQPYLKAEFVAWLRSRSIPLIDTHQAWAKLPPELTATYFRDDVHLTPAGNQAVAALIVAAIQTQQQFSDVLLEYSE